MNAVAIEHRRKLLHHLKALVWCLHQMQTRYDLNLVLYSLERRAIHSEIADSNLGDNLAFLLEHLSGEDLIRLGRTLRQLPESITSMDILDNHFEIGHYIQCRVGFGPVEEGQYGIISQISPQLRGLFHGKGNRLHDVAFDPSMVRCIFGTYII